MKNLVFISFSGNKTLKVAETFKTIIDTLYQSKDIEAYFSNSSIKPGMDYKVDINESLKKARCGISITSPENTLSSSSSNFASPWLMYEAGALAVSTAKNGGVLIPFLFCLSRDEFTSPFNEKQALDFQIRHESNLENIIKLFIAIDNNLDESNKIKATEIRSVLTRLWQEEGYQEKFDRMAKDVEDSSASSYGDKNLRTNNNNALSLSRMATLKTSDQNTITNYINNIAKTPANLEKEFESILNYQVPKNWKHQNPDDEQYKAHRVFVNNTRFSTFVAFTDGFRIILYNREVGKEETNVYNDRYDVFGSVQFENRTIGQKIQSEKFMNSEILSIEEITGIAVEENKAKKDNKSVETAVMLGICVYMKSEDLNLALSSENPAISILDTRQIFELNADTLTSKASLSIRHIFKRQIVKTKNLTLNN